MFQRFSLPALFFVLVLAVLSSGCPKKPKDTVPAEEPPAPPPVVEPPPAVTEPPKEVTESFPSQPVESRPVVEPTIEELNRRGVLQTVYFDFDKYDLDDGDRALLRANAGWLQEHASYDVVIEGHCDERGTIEYNLALGERRAKAVRDYLTSLGVTVSRMRLVSYGEERPAVPGSNETAWAKNRRAKFWIES